MQVRFDRRFASAALALTLSSTTALAAQAETTELDTLEEIIVTAQRREQRILDVPMSITALTGDALTRQGATSLLDIASRVPGLSTSQFSAGQNRVQLRGISSLQGLPTVGAYLDETSINVNVQGGGASPTFGADIRFIDLDRVEVLRGPQATLYGEGSMGGTIRYITRDPDLQKSSFGFESVAGGVEDGSELYRANVVVNMPVAEDVFALRFAGGYERSPGWIDYTAIGKEDANDATAKTARLKALWKISDAFSANLSLLWQDTLTNAQGFANDREAPFVILTPYDDELRLASLVLTRKRTLWTN